MIEDAYRSSGNSLGWRLLASPEATLDDAEVAFVGLNPGGTKPENDHAVFAPESKSAYVAESWAGAPPVQSLLQQQFRALFAGLKVQPEHLLAGNLVPFRSSSWATLQHAKSSVRFGERLWTQMIERARPSLIIAMGGLVGTSLKSILRAADETSVPVGWGRVKGRRLAFEHGALVVLPHLSRFPIVTRSKSQSALSDLFGVRWHA